MQQVFEIIYGFRVSNRASMVLRTHMLALSGNIDYRPTSGLRLCDKNRVFKPERGSRQSSGWRVKKGRCREAPPFSFEKLARLVSPQAPLQRPS